MRLLIVVVVLALCASVGGALLLYAFPNANEPDRISLAPARVDTLTKDSPEPIDARPLDSPSAIRETAPVGSRLPDTRKPNRIPLAGHVLKGQVIDVYRGTPISDVQVFAVLWDDSMRNPLPDINLGGASMDITDEEGRFELDNMWPSTYGVTTVHDTFIQTVPALKHTVSTNAESEPAVVMMQRQGLIAGAATLHGEPAPDQVISLSRRGRSRPVRTAATDNEGMYEFSGLPPGEFTVSTELSSVDGTGDYVLPAHVHSGKKTIVDFALETSDASIYGRIVPFDPVKYYAATATYAGPGREDVVFAADIASDGSFQFDGMPYGLFRVQVEAFMEKYKSKNYHRRLTAHIRTGPGQVAAHDFYFVDEFATEGIVKNLALDEPLTVYTNKNMLIDRSNPDTIDRIHASPATHFASVDTDGGFRFEGLEPGTYQIVAQAGDNRYGLATILVEPTPVYARRNSEPFYPLELWIEDN